MERALDQLFMLRLAAERGVGDPTHVVQIGTGHGVWRRASGERGTFCPRARSAQDDHSLLEQGHELPGHDGQVQQGEQEASHARASVGHLRRGVTSTPDIACARY